MPYTAKFLAASAFRSTSKRPPVGVRLQHRASTLSNEWTRRAGLLTGLQDMLNITHDNDSSSAEPRVASRLRLMGGTPERVEQGKRLTAAGWACIGAPTVRSSPPPLTRPLDPVQRGSMQTQQA